GELAEGLGITGRMGEGLTLIDDVLQRAESLDERWCFAELLRKKGELLLLRDEPADSAEAEACFRMAIEEARRQDALAWELRAATSLARLLRRRRQRTQARQILAPVYHRFTEGFSTPDLLAAKTLLASLG